MYILSKLYDRIINRFAFEFHLGGRGEERNRKKTRSINIGRGDGDKTRVLKQREEGGGKKKLVGILFEKKYYECYDWKWIRSI